MAYGKRSIHVSLAQVIGHIAAVETNGDRKAAIAELIAAAADDGIVALGRSDEVFQPEISRSWWQDLKRGEGRISDDEREIIFTCKRWNSLFNEGESRTVRFYDVEFYRADVVGLWPPKPKPAPSSPVGDAPKPPAASAPDPRKTRGGYRNELRSYLAAQELTILVRKGKDALAAEFVDYCRKNRPNLNATLPKPREIAKQAQKILYNRRTKPQQSSAGNRSQTPARPSNRV